MFRVRSAMCAILTLCLPATAFAQEAGRRELLAAFISWLPLLLLLAFFIYVWRGLARSRQRGIEHMDRVEAALGRIEAAMKNLNRGSGSES